AAKARSRGLGRHELARWTDRHWRPPDESGEGVQGPRNILSGGTHSRQSHRKNAVELRSSVAGNAARAYGTARNRGIDAGLCGHNLQDEVSHRGSDSES